MTVNSMITERMQQMRAAAARGEIQEQQRVRWGGFWFNSQGLLRSHSQTELKGYRVFVLDVRKYDGEGNVLEKATTDKSPDFRLVAMPHGESGQPAQHYDPAQAKHIGVGWLVSGQKNGVPYEFISGRARLLAEGVGKILPQEYRFTLNMTPADKANADGTSPDAYLMRDVEPQEARMQGPVNKPKGWGGIFRPDLSKTMQVPVTPPVKTSTTVAPAAPTTSRREELVQAMAQAEAQLAEVKARLAEHVDSPVDLIAGPNQDPKPVPATIDRKTMEVVPQQPADFDDFDNGELGDDIAF